jgi:hypothetical protein
MPANALEEYRDTTARAEGHWSVKIATFNVIRALGHQRTSQVFAQDVR